MKPLFLFSALFCFSTLVAAETGQKIGCVDMQKALESTHEFKAAKAAMQAQIDKKQGELNAQREELMRKQEKLTASIANLDPEMVEKERLALRQKQITLQESANQAQNDFQARESREIEGMVKKMRNVVAEIARKKKLDIVLESRHSVIFALPALDITDEVVRAYNQIQAR